MSVLSDIKLKYGFYRLKKEFGSNKNNPKVCNLYKAKSIGIIYDASVESEFKTVRSYIYKLKEFVPTVLSLAYVDKKELEGFHLQPTDFDFFCKKDLNWYGRPSKDFVKEFTNKEFDILIDLQLVESLPLRFVLADSKAKFKVGRKPIRFEQFYDLMIDVKPYVPLSYFAEQVSKYLEMINKKS